MARRRGIRIAVTASVVGKHPESRASQDLGAVHNDPAGGRQPVREEHHLPFAKRLSAKADAAAVDLERQRGELRAQWTVTESISTG